MVSIPKEYTDLLGPLDDIKTVLELGNKKNSSGLYREWYVERGMEYTSLDWNGQDGALKFDMRYSLVAEDVGGPYDAVTNIGFTEHVADQQACWNNVHNFVKVGGVIASALPFGPNWDHHGFWHPSLKWFVEFARLNGYDLEHSVIEDWHGNKMGTRKETRTRMRKIEDKPFAFPTTEIHRTPKPFSAEPQFD